MKTALFYTLGCKVNQYETEVLRRYFQAEGYGPCQPEEQPELIVLNSCTVTGQGDKKTLRQLRKLRRTYPDACIVLCGCFPQAFQDKAAEIEEADVITGTAGRNRLPEMVAEHFRTGKKIVSVLPHQKGETFERMEAVSFAERTRAYLKIQDGCQRRCAYCIIPDARGNYRSKPFAELCDELHDLADMGYKEVVLVGINLSMYGLPEGHTLADAVEAAEHIDGLERVRLGSLEPDLLDDAMLSKMAACKKLCPQFHIALQSGCDATLQRMRRHYDTAEFEDIANRLRKFFPNTAFTTDVMVGFAGETEAEFQQSMDFVRKIGFSKIHVFPYSVRPGTPAADFPDQVPEEEKTRRSRRMIALGDELRRSFLEQKCGQTEVVLVEREKDGFSFGHTKDYTPVWIDEQDLPKNGLISVKITGLREDGCTASVLK